jgi:hypothetical protein
VKPRAWMIQYGVAIIMASLIGVVFGNIPLFKQTSVGTTHLRAADIIQFIGYGGALVLLWLLARQVASVVTVDLKWSHALRHLLVPTMTLVVLCGAYGVLLLVCGPFLSKAGRTIYNWLFVTGISGVAVWMVITWFTKSARLIADFDIPRRSKRQAA